MRQHHPSDSPPSGLRHPLNDGILAFALLALPVLLFLEPLRRGVIPDFMDTVMYFVPLRVHAARLLAGGDWPLWNRCLMAGVPLFENPQAALAYPAHWPFLLTSSGFWFTFPILLHLGMWATLTFWALRRIGVRRGGAMFAGALALAGSYGWSRMQYGNFMNVLPWWPLWIGAAHAFAVTGGPLFLLAGGAAVALSVLGGAHQLAAYGLIGLGVYGLTQITLARGHRGRWFGFLVLTFIFGVGVAAPGWLPQTAFIRETARPQGLASREVLAGAIGTWGELSRALTGDWPLVKIRPGAPWSDAESSAAIGLAALMLAGLMPRRRALRRAWVGCWLAALLGIALSLRTVMAPLIEALPQAGIFHDPRRWLGLSQAMLILAAGLGAATLGDFARHPRPRALLSRLIPAGLILAAVAAAQWPAAPRVTLVHAAPALMILILAPVVRWRAVRLGLGLALAAAVALLGHATWVTTDLKTRSLTDLCDPRHPSLIDRAGLNPGQRFFVIDWQRAASYDYTRPDLADSALPNLACLWGLEDLGGYEPAQSERYRAFMQRIHQDEPWRMVSPQHFGLVGTPFAGAALNEANVHAALFPRWGVPSYPLPGQPPVTMAYPRGYNQNFEVRVLLVNPAGDAEFAVPQDGNTWRYPLSMPQPPSARDDLVASTATYAGQRPAPPLTDAVRATAANLPPQFGSQPLPWVLRLPASTRLVGVYTWSPDLDRHWSPLLMGEITVLMRYKGTPAWTAWTTGAGEVLTRTIKPNRLDLEVRVTSTTQQGTARLVIHDAYWPGWEARIDGRPIEIRQEGLWRALELPLGSHAVAIEYRPPWVPLALWICAGAVVALVFISMLLGIGRAHGRKRRLRADGYAVK